MGKPWTTQRLRLFWSTIRVGPLVAPGGGTEHVFICVHTDWACYREFRWVAGVIRRTAAAGQKCFMSVYVCMYILFVLCPYVLRTSCEYFVHSEHLVVRGGRKRTSRGAKNKAFLGRAIAGVNVCEY